MTDPYQFERNGWPLGDRLLHFATDLTATQQLATCAAGCETLIPPLRYFSLERPFLVVSETEFDAIDNLLNEVWRLVADPRTPSPLRDLLADVDPEQGFDLGVLAPVGVPVPWEREIDGDESPGAIAEHAGIAVCAATWSLLGYDAEVTKAGLQAVVLFADQLDALLVPGPRGDDDEAGAIYMVEAVMDLITRVPEPYHIAGAEKVRSGARQIATELMEWVLALDPVWQQRLSTR